jgi:hypothetical protein
MQDDKKQKLVTTDHKARPSQAHKPQSMVFAYIFLVMCLLGGSLSGPLANTIPAAWPVLRSAWRFNALLIIYIILVCLQLAYDAIHKKLYPRTHVTSFSRTSALDMELNRERSYVEIRPSKKDKFSFKEKVILVWIASIF